MRVLVVAFTVLCGSLLVACGDEDDEQTSTATPTEAVTATVAPAPSPSPAPTVNPCPTVQTTGLGQLMVASAPQGPQVTLSDVAVSTTQCYDRIVFEFAEANLPGHQINYVQSWFECGSGAPVSTQGFAQLRVTMEPAVAHDANGNVTVPALSLMPSYPSLKEARSTCDFEGEVSWVIGTELRFFTVSYGTSPTQIIIDIYH